jgi:hypothetical protein
LPAKSAGVLIGLPALTATVKGGLLYIMKMPIGAPSGFFAASSISALMSPKPIS